jgi:hypothetical protein
MSIAKRPHAPTAMPADAPRVSPEDVDSVFALVAFVWVGCVTELLLVGANVVGILAEPVAARVPVVGETEVVPAGRREDVLGEVDDVI